MEGYDRQIPEHEMRDLALRRIHDPVLVDPRLGVEPELLPDPAGVPGDPGGPIFLMC